MQSRRLAAEEAEKAGWIVHARPLFSGLATAPRRRAGAQSTLCFMARRTDRTAAVRLATRNGRGCGDSLLGRGRRKVETEEEAVGTPHGRVTRRAGMRDVAVGMGSKPISSASMPNAGSLLS